METVKAYVNENNMATVVCASCGRKKTIDASRFKGCNKGVRVKCACSSSFIVLFERRRYYRKNVNLTGQFHRAHPASETGEIVVNDISRSGIRFTTREKSGLQIDEIIKITVVLDDKARSVISQNAVIRRVEDLTVAAQFCDSNPPRALAFYLMP